MEMKKEYIQSNREKVDKESLQLKGDEFKL